MTVIVLGRITNKMMPHKRKNVMYSLQSDVVHEEEMKNKVLEPSDTSVEELEGAGFKTTGAGFKVKTGEGFKTSGAGFKGGSVQPKNEKLRKFVSLKIKR